MFGEGSVPVVIEGDEQELNWYNLQSFPLAPPIVPTIRVHWLLAIASVAQRPCSGEVGGQLPESADVLLSKITLF
jgi:hypothetical protein